MRSLNHPGLCAAWVLQWVVGDAFRGSTLEIPDATGIFGVGTKFGTSERTEEVRHVFFGKFQLQGGAPI